MSIETSFEGTPSWQPLDPARHVAASGVPSSHATSSRDGSGTLLIYAPVPLRRGPTGLLVERQAANGIRLWAENFVRVIVLMPLAEGPPRGDWIPLDGEGVLPRNVQMEWVPEAYRPDRFLRALPAVRRKLRRLIGEADHLSFAIGGLFGDWGATASFEAHRMGRPFAVWTDRVESEVVRRTAGQGRFKSRLRARLTHRPMAWLERAVIRRAALGLFHGRETFEAYAPWSANPQIVHDIHIATRDHLGPAGLERKVAACAEGPLKLCYVGRADAMKGPLDWIAALEALAAQGVDFQATWLGQGELLEEMRSRIELLGLGSRVSAPGHASNREMVLDAMREAHLFMFCHLTPESPRCLIEALVSACPIVGYGSAYASDLIAGNDGGVLVERGDVSGLAQAVVDLAGNRAKLSTLMRRAALDGAPFDDVSVFRHRSELIKEHLPLASSRSN